MIRLKLTKKIASAAAAMVVAAVFAYPIHAAEKNETETAQSDSCAAAFATLMAQQLKPMVEKSFDATPDSIAEFTRGVAHAFDIKNIDAPYYLGVRSGMAMIDRLEQMQQMGFPITEKAFCSYLYAAMTSTALNFDQQSADEFLRQWMLRKYESEAPAPLSPESQQDYIDDNKARDGVIETSTGLLFEVITEGEGEHPTNADKVKVIYTGRLSDGTVFDSTEKPIQFPVANLVPGFTEGLKLMKPGGEYRIIIPPALGYGDKGAAGVIPPGAVLDFTVKLLEIVK